MSQFFISGGQSIGTSASASVLPMDIQDWFPLGWTGWISGHPKGLSRGTHKSLFQHHSSKASFLWHSAFFIVQLSHPYMTPGKTIALTRQTFFGKLMSLPFNILSGLVIAFLPRSMQMIKDPITFVPILKMRFLLEIWYLVLVFYCCYNK